MFVLSENLLIAGQDIVIPGALDAKFGQHCTDAQRIVGGARRADHTVAVCSASAGALHTLITCTYA